MKVALIAILVAILSAPAGASENWRNLAFDIGQSTSNSDLRRPSFDLYRVGLQREFSKPLWEGEHTSLGGYFEASVNFWDARDEEIYALAFSPVLALYFGHGNGSFRPYFEAGLGGALLSDRQIAGRDLSTNFQFEVRFGIGLRSERYDVHARYMHYSNGSIEQPNHGVDAFLIGVAVGF